LDSSWPIQNPYLSEIVLADKVHGAILISGCPDTIPAYCSQIGKRWYEIEEHVELESSIPSLADSVMQVRNVAL
jgi:hypothetical protein